MSFRVVRTLRTSLFIMAGRTGHTGPRNRASDEDLEYTQCDLPIDEGSHYGGPLLVAYGAEELYNTTGRSGAVRASS